MENLFVKNAMFTSDWESLGEITTNCKVNMKTREVFDIEPAGIDVDDILIREFITIDGEEYLCGSATSETEGWNEETDYWYK